MAELTKAEKAAAEKAAAEKAAAEAKRGYFIAPGKCLTSPRGILGPGDRVRESTWPKGKEDLTKWVKAEYVVP